MKINANITTHIEAHKYQPILQYTAREIENGPKSQSTWGNSPVPYKGCMRAVVPNIPKAFMCLYSKTIPS